MSQTPQAEKKNRFQISQEVQEEFVNNIAQTMLDLAQTAGEWKKAWNTEVQLGMPFCPVTGREYSGANMVALMLTCMVKGFDDDRWLTFKQLQKFQSDNQDLEMKIGKGQKGVKLLRPEELYFTVDEDGQWKFLSQEQIREYKELRAQGIDTPEVQHKTLFYPFTVFNAAQIEGFPQKEYVQPALSEVERNELVERFIACSGIAVNHYNGGPCFNPDEDIVKLPHPERFTGTDEYYATKLHEVFHATGHESREGRIKKDKQTIKGYAFEEMRAEMFSMLAGARLDLPMPQSNSSAYIKHWNETFSGGDARAVFRAASEAGKILTVLHQFEVGEEPRAKWFSRREAWPELIEMQKQRDIACGVSHKEVESGTQVFTSAERPAPPTFSEAVAVFKDTEDLALKARLILQSPEFLNMALKHDPESIKELAQLCNQMAQVLHMEADEKLNSPSAMQAPPIQNEQRPFSGARLR